MSDDHATGKSTVDESASTDPGSVSTDADGIRSPQAGTPDRSPSSRKSADGAADGRSGAGRPQRDSHVDTGVVPVGSPQLPPLRVPGSVPRTPMRGPKLIPGASVAGGRYRLLAPHGGARGLRFWQAQDVKLDREVALTFVDAEQRAGDVTGPDGPQAILSRTLRLGRINSPGLARVLDVVRGSSGGIVVAEWTPGRSLREMSGTEPSPLGAARAVQALAAAAEAAHRGGGALSIDHPDRIRISVAGDAVLAFPATFADADVTSDVRGLGAGLYGLITARWPLPEQAAPGQQPPAPTDRKSVV